MVKVGNIECGFLKFTPWSRTAAIAGADSGVTFSARRPSGTNRIRLCGVVFCAHALVAANANRLAVSGNMARRMTVSLMLWIWRHMAARPLVILLYDRFVTAGIRRGAYARKKLAQCRALLGNRLAQDTRQQLHGVGFLDQLEAVTGVRGQHVAVAAGQDHGQAGET